MIPLPEYPRPQLRRDSFINLNGAWQYAITKCEKKPQQYDGEILVPYSPESERSGVKRQLKPGEWLHYHRKIVLKKGQGRTLLHFGAVDYQCVVRVNGKTVGKHRGGYLPFSFDITECVRDGENTLDVSVQDPSEMGCQARGKQKLKNGGMFYTAQSGIWQTVWLEQVPEHYVEQLRITPVYSAQSIRIEVISDRAGEAEVTLYSQGKRIVGGRCDADGRAELSIPEAYVHPWSPEDPFLYDIIVQLGEDRAESYAALREYSVQKDGRGIWRFCLNGKPCFLHGLLDQGYWKEGLYTPPSDEAMVYDIQTARSMGFNLLRKHVKIEPERWYYHCDRLGMMVWQDMVNGGDRYKIWFVTYAANILQPLLRKWPDNHYGLLARKDKSERARYQQELSMMVETLYNHPSIACWVPFNEGWGQFDACKMTQRIREMDSTRLIEEASGWFDQGGGDFYSIHNYFYPLWVRPDRKRAVLLSEFGGIAWPYSEESGTQKVYGYGTARSGEELARRYRKQIEKEIIPQIRRGLSGIIYTQLSDVEEEVNGILSYDRRRIKLDPETARDCSKKLFEEYRKSI